MVRRRAGAACALISASAAIVLWAAIGAAGDIKVVLIGSSGADTTVARVRQELLLLGVDVDVVAPDPGTDLAAVARDHAAAAAARVESAPPEIVLWVDAAHSAGTSQETRVSESFSGRAEPGLLALRAVELLRGRLLPVPVASASPSTSASDALPPPATATARAPVAPPLATADHTPHSEPLLAPVRPSRGNLHIGPAITVSPGGVPVAPSLRVGGALRIARHLELDALAVIPLSAGTVSAPEGEMDLRVLALGAGAALQVFGPEAALSLRAGGGIGAAGFFYDGRAKPPWISASGDRWAALPFLDIGAGYRITSVIAVRADVLAALIRPEPVLVIAGQSVASFGTPAVFTSIALEVHP